MAEKSEKLYDVWARRTPLFERVFRESVFYQFTDFGKGANSTTDAKGKILGAAYEIFILAYFIGLYSNQRQRLGDNKDSFGQPIQFWGNKESKDRKQYPKLREYIFVSLVARTDIDMIELDKGNISIDKVVDLLMQTMNEYANYGFYVIREKMEKRPDFFFNQRSFLNLFLELTSKQESKSDEDDNMPEEF